jgi:hypothetical protein
MNENLLALIFRPLLLFLLVAFVLYPARIAFTKWLPEGRIKRILLWRLGKP